jgi:polyphosphate kinase 2
MGDKFKEQYDNLTERELDVIHAHKGLVKMLSVAPDKLKKAIDIVQYEAELEQLQEEMVKLQYDVQENNRRVMVIFEGRDAAGKGGSIKRFTEHLSPRGFRVVALGKPTEVERGQWYFQRYVPHLPNPGEMVFFDRSWYNRALVEPVMGFCTPDQHKRFLRQVPEFEHMLFEDGIEIIKFWFSISQKEPKRRFEERKSNPLKHWKLSPVDLAAQQKWDDYTKYKTIMFSRSHSEYCPWIVVKGDVKKKARLEAMRYMLFTLNYAGKEKAGTTLEPDPNTVMRYFREATWDD